MKWISLLSLTVVTLAGSVSQAGFKGCGGLSFDSKAAFEKYLEEHLVFGFMDTLIQDATKFVSESPKIVDKSKQRYVLNTVAIDPEKAPLDADGFVRYDDVRDEHKITIQVAVSTKSCAVLSVNRVESMNSKPVKVCESDAKTISQCR